MEKKKIETYRKAKLTWWMKIQPYKNNIRIWIQYNDRRIL